VQTRTISEKGLPKRPYDRLRMAATGLDRRRREVDDCAGRKRLLTAGEARRRQVSLMRGDACNGEGELTLGELGMVSECDRGEEGRGKGRREQDVGQDNLGHVLAVVVAEQHDVLD
jgi:hypothetical protein